MREQKLMTIILIAALSVMGLMYYKANIAPENAFFLIEGLYGYIGFIFFLVCAFGLIWYYESK